MKRVIIICEGETEREFCQKVLAPHLAQHDIFIQAPLIKKSIGGIVRWSVLKKEIETYLLESNVIVTTLIDYYGLLKKYNFPKWDEGERIVDKNARMDFLEKGKTPFIRLMFRSVFEQNQEDPKYKMKDILNGRYDAAIIAWANEAKNCSTNLLVEFGTEVNGVWFSWNGYYYGGGTCDEYGDPNYPDGPEIFRDSYRHIIDLCNQQGCDNFCHRKSS